MKLRAKRGQSGKEVSISSGPQKSIPISGDKAPSGDDRFLMRLFDAASDGREVVTVMESPGIPQRAQRLPMTADVFRQAQHLVTDVIKGGISLPNRTLELVFKPEIQQGLRDGSFEMMKTKSGETLADAVGKNGLIVGKGRVVQAGELRQLAVGAFQLASIAVAQSHLADIERSLKVLRCDLEKVLDMLDSEDRANLTGTIDYLKGIAEFLQSHQSPSEMPMQIRNQVETIVRGFHIWRDKLDNDMCNAVDRVKKQSDLDKLGNQNTFIAMQGHLGDAAKLSTRRELLRNMFMVLKVVTIYADPMGMQFSKFQLDEDLWTKRAKEFNDAFYAQTNSLFTKVLFASDETLGLKRDYLSKPQTLI